MKKLLFIAAMSAPLFSCEKEQGSSLTLEHESSFAAYALVQDTITLPNGQKAVLQEVCHTDTVVINTGTLAAVTTVFEGSSTAYMWPKLETTFDIPIIRRAISGKGIQDLIYHFDTAVAAKNPRQIITYVGDNDVDWVDYLTDSAIVSRYKKLIDRHMLKCPNALSLYVSIKPNPSKPYTSRIIWINSQIEAYIAGKKNQVFVNTFPMMYSDGKFNLAMYDPNGSVHLRNPQGYDAWEAFIKNYMIKN
jgi:hypothetical protein